MNNKMHFAALGNARMIRIGGFGITDGESLFTRSKGLCVPHVRNLYHHRLHVITHTYTQAHASNGS